MDYLSQISSLQVVSKFKQVTCSNSMNKLVHQVVARYKEKKQVRSEEGGKTTVYLYSDKQVQHRNREKAKRLEKLSEAIKDLRAKVKRDIQSEDPETRLIATVVALIDETHERVGSKESAQGDLNNKGEPHYGVTQWLKSQVSIGTKSATIKYVGKSAVKHHKTVTTPYVLTALRKAYNDAENKDSNLFAWEGGVVTPEKVNKFLAFFDVSAKDLRGLAANNLMKEELKKVRKGELPTDVKERKEQLKEEFKKALDNVAIELGHESSTLKNQYLAPSVEPSYLKDGTIIEKLDE
jgi:DNA topoisomerase I